MRTLMVYIYVYVCIYVSTLAIIGQPISEKESIRIQNLRNIVQDNL